MYALEQQADFNADVRKPYLTDDEVNEDDSNPDFMDIGSITFNIATDTYEDFKLYFRRLEDISVAYLSQYLGNVLYNIKNMSGCTAGLLQYNAAHPMQLNYTLGDDEDITEIADLVSIENNNTDATDKIKALSALPYVLKRLHCLSVYSGVSVLSCIQAHAKAVRFFTLNRPNSTRKIKHNDLIEQGVWLVDQRGYACRKVTVDQKNQRAMKMCDWVLGIVNTNPSFLEDLHNFNYYCNILNIDLINDDMTRYDYDFIIKLQCTKLTPNYQYQREIYQDLLTNQKTSKVDIDDVYAVMHQFDNLLSDNSAFENIDNISTRMFELFDKCNKDLAYSISAMTGNLINRDAMYYANGFLYHNGSPIVLPAHFITRNNETIYDKNFIIHELGFCIALTKSAKLYAIQSPSAMDNFMILSTTRDTEVLDYTKWGLYQ